MKISKKNKISDLGIDKRVSQFILPLGCTVNMDCTASMESVAAIAISQMEGIQLSVAQVCSISIIAMLTMILISVGVNTRYIAFLWAIGCWISLEGGGSNNIFYNFHIFKSFFIRISSITVVNVFGDSEGCAVVENICWEEIFESLQKEDEQVSPASSGESESKPFLADSPSVALPLSFEWIFVRKRKQVKGSLFQ